MSIRWIQARWRAIRNALSSAADAVRSGAVWRDFWKWFGEVFKHWIGYVGCGTVATFQIVYGVWKREWPPAMSWLLLLGCFIPAAFISWRKEHQESLSVDRRATLRKVRDLIAETKNAPSDSQYDSFGALLKYSEELRTDEDVAWVCNQLQAGGHDHPFGLLELTCNHALTGRWLTFLQEARVSNLSIKKVRTAVAFAAKQWSGKESYLKGREEYTESEKAKPLIVDGRSISLLIPIEIEEPESDQDRRAKISLKLSTYVEVGNSILVGCQQGKSYKQEDIDAWISQVGGLVALIAGEAIRSRLSNSVGLPVVPAWPEQRFLYTQRVVFDRIYPYVYRLTELIEKIESGDITPFSNPMFQNN